jgi:hypothetical protein
MRADFFDHIKLVRAVAPVIHSRDAHATDFANRFGQHHATEHISEEQIDWSSGVRCFDGCQQTFRIARAIFFAPLGTQGTRKFTRIESHNFTAAVA